MKLTKEIKEYICDQNIMSGQTTTATCPFCHKEKKMSITKDRGCMLYHCYSASCGAQGRINIGLTANDVRVIINSRAVDAPPHHIEMRRMPSWVPVTQYETAVRYLKANHCWEAYVAGYPIYYDVKLSRVVFPAFIGGKMVDACGRTLIFKKNGERLQIPKWFRYNKSGLPLFVNPMKHDNVLVIVEDAASACAISRVAKACALMGTNLTPQAKLAIINSMGEGIKKIIVCLDKDATHKALKLVTELSSHVETIARVLPDDAKYLTVDVIKKELGL